MSLPELAWLALAAYAAHILEEYSLDWRNWARAVIRLPVEWSDFYVTNAVVVVLGMAQAGLAPSLAMAPLSFAALMLINAVFFHILPVIRTRGRFSPGLGTALCLFLPLGVTTFLQAHAEGRLTAGNAAGALALGAALMAFPVILLLVKNRPYFRQA